MTYVDYAAKLNTLKYLVERKQSGTPQQLAERLSLSERTLLRMVQQLRDGGYPVVYNRCRCAYELSSR